MSSDFANSATEFSKAYEVCAANLKGVRDWQGEYNALVREGEEREDDDRSRGPRRPEVP